MRLDRALAERGVARSRSHAQELIRSGAVAVDGATVTRPSHTVSADTVITVSADARYVSRAAFKLAGALEACAPLGLNVAGMTVLDAGASTGGFTQTLLEHGVAHVLAVDVGHGQMAAAIAADPRVTSREGVNVRDLSASAPGAGVDLVVADLSFISLRLVLPALADFAREGAQMLLMVKPQFEVGRERLGAGGVVTSLADRAAAVAGVLAAARALGLVVRHVARSGLPGPHGNVEFFVWVGGPWQARSDSEQEPAWPVLDQDAENAAIRREVHASGQREGE
ncbi:TlyA family RNA methyltransferase [Demequina capsici]|uniref:TlyA family RNA methyltransferase n=1 Tax=Demequina capsici TaxID=3075620 RepID=A0AA96J9L0_9MICO|nr:TlyA family RNA methyltransferase [Demequina sp. PMTSA13]WNM26128.1 TlyA family RNA methyltransferase [Demequina sp. PMTSA13]